MNEIVKFLLTRDKYISKLHLRQQEFTYSACRPFTNHCERIKIFKETGDYIFKNKLDKACSANDAVYVNSKDLAR